MIFNPRRGGGEKEYKISVSKIYSITLSVTKQKPGHVFQATANTNVHLKMNFTDPDTGEEIMIQGSSRRSNFVMPCADVHITY